MRFGSGCWGLMASVGRWVAPGVSPEAAATETLSLNPPYDPPDRPTCTLCSLRK